MRVCPSCGRNAPEGVRFCAYCGAELDATPAREERKVVSVVFIDLVGHTARSEAADPEDVRALLAPYHARARAHLERFGGTVEKFIGDAVMAVFGAPTAHEDDAERAVRAALAVRDAFAEEALDVRVAVNTGEALVSLGARPEAGEAIVAGDVVNTAARLQSAAPINGVLVGEVTRRATDRAIEYREAPSVDAKGKTAPVPAWEAVGARARQGIDASPGASAPLVGRDAERRLLVDAADRAARERTLQLVTLVGAPGIGKSRLVLELYRELDARPGIVATWRQGRALAYGGGAFDPIADVVRAEAGILETDDPELAADRLRTTVAALAVDEAECEWLHRRLLPLFAEQAEHASRDESYSAWQRFFELLAERLPLVLVLEDMHWADDATLDFVDYLADWSGDSPLFVLTTARPELLERRPSWGGGRVNSQTVAVAPLDDEATARLLQHVVGRSVVDAETQQAVLAQAGGNPLYAEEFARLVADTGATAEIPPTVHGVIAARLDVLRPEEKAFLQDAAVLGNVFWRRGVTVLGSPVADEVVLSLTRKDILRRARISSVAGETELAFRHALVRDVAYAEIPRARRAEKHRLAAEWIASTTSSRPDLVAHHYLEAISLGRAVGADVGDLVAPAVAALADAGDRAAALGAADTALASYDAALDLAGDNVQLLLAAERAAQLMEAGSGTYGQRALVCAEAEGDRVGMSLALTALGTARWYAGDVAEARALRQRAVAIARETRDAHALASALDGYARLLNTSGLPDEAMAAAEEALPLAEAAGLELVAIGVQTTIGSVRALASEDGRELLRSAAQRSLALGDLDSYTRARNNLQYALWRIGDLDAAEHDAEETMEQIGQYRLPTITAWMAANVAWSLVQRGRWDAALEKAAEYERALRGRSFYLDPHLEAGIVIIRLARDEPEPLRRLRDLVDDDGDGDVLDGQSDVAPLACLAFAEALADNAAQAERIVRKIAATPASMREHVACIGASLGPLVALTGVDLLHGIDAPGRWLDANLAFAKEGFDAGIAILDEMGATGESAAIRLLALKAGRGKHSWAREVEAFAREVSGTRWLRDLAQLAPTRRTA